MTRPSMDELLTQVYRHYPRNIDGDDSGYVRTEEFRRLDCVLHACAANAGVRLPPIPESDRVPLDHEVAEVLQALSAWPAFKAALARDFPGTFIWDQSPPWAEPVYRCDIPARGHTHGSADDFDPLVCVLGVLAPVYALFCYERRSSTEVSGLSPQAIDDGLVDSRPRLRYSKFAESYREREAILTERIETMFSFARLTDETLRVPVPDIAPRGSNLLLGEATMMDCLFTSHY